MLESAIVECIEGFEAVSPAMNATVLSIGNFDGVHVGHQVILERAREIAARLGSPQVVVTFEPHPLTIVAAERAPKCLTPLREKLRILEELGVDAVVVARSDRGLLSMPPEDFVRDLVMPRFRPAYFVEGRSFSFGHRRAGNVETLGELGNKYGFHVTVVEPVRLNTADGKPVTLSSSAVRRWLEEGAVEQARLALGRPYALLGQVGAGAARGRGLGFPTANLVGLTQLIPREGVYAGYAEVGEHRWPAAISIGVKPTFGATDLTVEAYLLGFQGDLYGRSIRLSFLKWLRGQLAFASAEPLQRQMALDVEAVRSAVEQHSVQGSP